MSTNSPAHAGRSARLKLISHDVHEQIDQRITAYDPFADRSRYGAFLRSQFRLHRDVQALFAAPALNRLLPGLSARCRLQRVRLDLQDLQIALDEQALPAPAFVAEQPVSPALALGWLYTVEGSNLGAAFLLKAAARLGLDGSFGARHRAPHASGRASHWHDFVAQLDAVQLPPEQEAEVDAGAQAAFTAAKAYTAQYGLGA
jgi:heme oxygenase